MSTEAFAKEVQSKVLETDEMESQEESHAYASFEILRQPIYS